MPTIEELRNQTATARLLLEQKRNEAQQIQAKLDEEEASLPSNTSQRALRRDFSGLQGRNVRAQINQSRAEIGVRRAEVGRYQDEVLNPYEQDIVESEGQIADYGERQRAYEKISGLIGDKDYEYKLALEAQYGRGYEQDYAEQALQDIYAGREFNVNLQEAIDQYNAGATEEQAFKGLNLDYLKRKGIVRFEGAQVGSPEALQGAQNQNIFFNTNNLDPITGAVTRLDRNTKVKIFPQSTNRRFATGFELVSAQPTEYGYSSAFGNNSRQSLLVDSTQRDGSDSGGWFSRLVTAFKKDPYASREIYSEELGGFVQAQPSGQYSGSVNVRLPTEKEQAAIAQAKYKGSFANIAEIPNRLTVKAFGEPQYREVVLTDPAMGKQYIQRFSNTQSSGGGNQLPSYATKPFDLAAEYTLRAGEGIARGLKRAASYDPYQVNVLNPGQKGTAVLGFSQNAPQSKASIWFNNAMDIPSPISREQAKGFLSAAYTFAAFEPLMSTGTAQISQMDDGEEIIEVVINGQLRRFTKKEFERLFGTRLQATFEFKLAARERQLEILKKAFKNRYYLDQESLLKDINTAKEFMRQAGLSDYEAESLIAELFPQMRPKVPVVSVFEDVVKTPVKSSTGGVRAVTQAPRAPRITGTIGGGRTEMFPLVNARTNNLRGVSGVESLFGGRSRPNQKDSVLDTVKTNQQSGQGSKAFFGNLPRQRSRQSSNQVPNVGQDFGSFVDTIPRSDTATSQKFFPKQRSASRSAQGFGQFFEDFTESGRPSKPKTPKLPSGKSNPFLASAFEKIDTWGFDVVVRRGKKDRIIGSAGSVGNAGNILFGKLKGSLAASGFVINRKTGQKVGLDMLGFGSEFTRSKRDPYRVVQRRGYRLSSGGERAEIKASRKNTINWLGGSSRKGKSKRIKWF